MVTSIDVESMADQRGAEELAFRFRGGRLCLNFTATVGERWRRAFERLRLPADLSRWFSEAGTTTTAVPVSWRTLRAARELREAIFRLMTAQVDGRPSAAGDVALVNTWASKAPPAPQLQRERGRWISSTVGVTATQLLALIARDAVDLLAGPDAGRLSRCASKQCGLLFLDTSRTRSRRWCSMNDCGARDKMARYRAGRKEDHQA